MRRRSCGHEHIRYLIWCLVEKGLKTMAIRNVLIGMGGEAYPFLFYLLV